MATRQKPNWKVLDRLLPTLEKEGWQTTSQLTPLGKSFRNRSLSGVTWDSVQARQMVQPFNQQSHSFLDACGE
jgi:hypothetical protein